MAKVKLIKSYYNKDNGESYIAISTQYGIFEGKSKVHEEDKDIASEYIGCNYAEMKAMVKYEKAKLKEMIKKLDIIAELNNNINRVKGSNKNSIESRYIRKQYYILEKEIKEQKMKIEYLQTNLYNAMQNYREDKENFDKKIKEIKEKREATTKE